MWRPVPKRNILKVAVLVAAVPVVLVYSFFTDYLYRKRREWKRSKY